MGPSATLWSERLLEHGLTLVTRDRRAVDVYRQFGVTFELLG